LNFPEVNLAAQELSDERVYKSHIIPCGMGRMGDYLSAGAMVEAAYSGLWGRPLGIRNLT
ncbi:MAG: hypothetical protein WAW12_04975, partial [Pseudomonas sp.]